MIFKTEQTDLGEAYLAGESKLMTCNKMTLIKYYKLLFSNKNCKKQGKTSLILLNSLLRG